MARHRSDSPVDQYPPGREPQRLTPPNGVQVNAAAAPPREDRGASAVEHGLLLFAVAATLVAVVFAFGGVVRGTFDTTCEALTTGTPITPVTNCGPPPAPDPGGIGAPRDLVALDPLQQG